MSALLPTWLLSSFQSSESNRFPRLLELLPIRLSLPDILRPGKPAPARVVASRERERGRGSRVYPVLTYSYRSPGMNRADGWRERGREGGREGSSWFPYVTGRCNQEQFTNSARCIGTDLFASRNLVISIVSMNNVVQSSPVQSPLPRYAIVSIPRFLVAPEQGLFERNDRGKI